VIARDGVEAVFREASGGEKIVEEWGGDLVFGGLAGVGDVAGGEDEIDGMAVVAMPGDRLDEGFEDDIAVVGISGFEVEIGDVEPGDGHWG
jgi:hypothetical protein